MNYKQKYLKYKLKYLLLKQQEHQQNHNLIGGMDGVKEIFRRVDLDYELEEELEKYKGIENIIKKEESSESTIPLTSYSTPSKTNIKTLEETPGAPKGERPQEILSITSNRLRGEDDITSIIKRLKDRSTDEDPEKIFEKLFDKIFQLDNKEEDEIMILNLVLFIKDLEHDYENYLKEEKPDKDDKINIIIQKFIRKLDTKIKLENYSFDLEMFQDEILRQKYTVEHDEINDTYSSLLLRGILNKSFDFEIPEIEYYKENILQDQGYNPTNIKAERIELDGLIEVTGNVLLGLEELNKKNIYKYITEKWLTYIFISLCRLEVSYLVGNDLYIIQSIFSSIMEKTQFEVTINNKEWKLKIIYSSYTFEKDILDMGIAKNAFKLMYELDIKQFCMDIINEELINIISNKKDIETIKKILWTRLRDIFKLVFGSLKTLGDKSYEFLIVIFIMKYIKDSNTKFLIETRDNHFINSLFINIIPLMELLNNDKDLDKFNLGIRFPINKTLLKDKPSLKDNKSVIFTHNETYSTAELGPSTPPQVEVSPLQLKTPYETPRTPETPLEKLLPETPLEKLLPETPLEKLPPKTPENSPPITS